MTFFGVVSYLKFSRKSGFCNYVEPTWPNPENQLQTAPLLSPTSIVDEKAHEIGEKGACWRMRMAPLVAHLSHYFRDWSLRHGLVHSAGS